MRRASIVIGSCMAAVAGGCLQADPLAGTWQVTRTLGAHTIDCNRFAGSRSFELTIRPGAKPELAAPDLFDGGDNSIDGAEVTFVTEEWAQTSEGATPELVAHHLAQDGDQLDGTAWSQGDGSELGCTYAFAVIAVRAP